MFNFSNKEQCVKYVKKCSENVQTNVKGDLKLILYHQKQKGINQNFQKFKCKPQLAYYICSFACRTSLTSRHNLIIKTLQPHEFMRNGQNDRRFV